MCRPICPLSYSIIQNRVSANFPAKNFVESEEKIVFLLTNRRPYSKIETKIVSFETKRGCL